ncbi:MAG: ABC-2 transporter permease [Lachnospiraceae bacterium]|nr:ABC-2 transporter permease [Lachnospiraceae bacterium]
MFGLIKKDLYMTRVSQMIFVISSLFYISMYVFIKEVAFEGYIKDTTFSRTALSCFPLIIVLRFNSRSLTTDHFIKNCEKYFNSLPVSSLHMVLSKFLSAIFVTTYGLIISIISLILFSYLDDVTCQWTDLKRILIVYFFILMILALQMPVLILSGNETLSLILPIFLLVSIPTVATIITKKDFEELIPNAIARIKNHQILYHHFTLITFIVTLILLMISLMISIRLYERREF